MQRDCALRIAGRRNQSLFECAELFTKEELKYTCHYAVFEDNMSSCRSLRGIINGMIEVGWSARWVARQLGRSDCVVRRCWDQWIREMSFTRRPGSGCPRQTSRREDLHIVRNARLQPTV
ncbi:transposable element Tcb2 transposase [Trichonephila clavipes]|nr:transposable element Tcb2 transposase [Trichonephila clavipes]